MGWTEWGNKQSEKLLPRVGRTGPAGDAQVPLVDGRALSTWPIHPPTYCQLFLGYLQYLRQRKSYANTCHAILFGEQWPESLYVSACAPLCSSGCPRTHSVDQAGLKLTEMPKVDLELLILLPLLPSTKIKGIINYSTNNFYILRQDLV